MTSCMVRHTMTSLLFGSAYPSIEYCDGAFTDTFCRRKKYPKTPLQIYKAIFAMQNHTKNSPIKHKAHYASLFLALLLDRFACLKDKGQKYTAIVCKRTKGLAEWSKAALGFFYQRCSLREQLPYIFEREFWDTFCSLKRCQRMHRNEPISLAIEAKIAHSKDYPINKNRNWLSTLSVMEPYLYPKKLLVCFIIHYRIASHPIDYG